MDSTTLRNNVEGAQLGLGIVRSLIGIDSDEVQNAAVKAYEDGNMRLWQKRAGLEETGIGDPKSEASGEVGEDMGHTVSIGNENHYHYEGSPPPPAPPPPAPIPAPQPPPAPAPTPGMSTLGKVAIGAALMLGGAGAGAAIVSALVDKQPNATQTSGKDTDTTVNVTIPEEDRIK